MEAPRALVLYVPLTSQNRVSRYEVPLPKLAFLAKESVANIQGLGSLPTARLGRRLGRVNPAVMEEIKLALAFRTRHCGLEPNVFTGQAELGELVDQNANLPLDPLIGAKGFNDFARRSAPVYEDILPPQFPQNLLPLAAVPH